MISAYDLLRELDVQDLDPSLRKQLDTIKEGLIEYEEAYIKNGEPIDSLHIGMVAEVLFIFKKPDLLYISPAIQRILSHYTTQLIRILV